MPTKKAAPASKAAPRRTPKTEAGVCPQCEGSGRVVPAMHHMDGVTGKKVAAVTFETLGRDGKWQKSTPPGVFPGCPACQGTGRRQ